MIRATTYPSKVQPGTLYITPQTNSLKDNDITKKVLKNGGKILVKDPYVYAKQYRKKLKAKTIMVCGSNAKTTIKKHLKAIIKHTYTVHITCDQETPLNECIETILNANFDTDFIIVEGAIEKSENRKIASLARPDFVIITDAEGSSFHTPRKNDWYSCFQARNNPEIIPYVWINESYRYYQTLKDHAQVKGFRVIPYKGNTKPEENIKVCLLVAQAIGCTPEDIQKASQLNRHILSTRVELPTISLTNTCTKLTLERLIFHLQSVSPAPNRKLVIIQSQGDTLYKPYIDKLEEAALDSNCLTFFTYNYPLDFKHPELSCQNFTDHASLNMALFAEIKPKDLLVFYADDQELQHQLITLIKQNYGTNLD